MLYTIYIYKRIAKIHRGNCVATISSSSREYALYELEDNIQKKITFMEMISFK